MSAIPHPSRYRPRVAPRTMLAGAIGVLAIGAVAGRLAISHYGSTVMDLTAVALAVGLLGAILTRKPAIGVASIVAALVAVPSYRAPVVQHLIMHPALALCAAVGALLFLATVPGRPSRISAIDLLVIALVAGMGIAMLFGPRSWKDALGQLWLWLPAYLAGRVIAARRPVNRQFAISVVAGGVALTPFAIVEALGLGTPFFNEANAGSLTANPWDQPHVRIGQSFRVQTSFGHPIAYSMFIAVAIVFAITLFAGASDVKRRRLYAAAIAILLVSEALAISRTGWVVLAVALVFLAANRRQAASRLARRAVLTGFCALVVAAIALPGLAAEPLKLLGLSGGSTLNGTAQYRSSLYTTAYQNHVASWFGNSQSKLAGQVQGFNSSIDSEYLNLLDLWGAVVAIPFVLIVLTMIGRALREGREDDDDWDHAYAATAAALGIGLLTVALVTQQEYFVWFMFGMAGVPRGYTPLLATSGPDGRTRFVEAGAVGASVAKTNGGLILPAVRRYWWIAALGAIIGGGLVVAAPRLRPKQYQATSAVLFETPHFDQILFGRNLVGFRTLPYRQAATHLNLITLPVVASDTARVVGHGLTAAQVAADITVTEVERSDVYTIEATASSPALATKLANAYADQFLHTAAVEDRQRIQSAIANIQRKLAQLSPAEGGAAATLSLQRTLQDLQVVASLQTGNVELIQRASPGLSAAKTVKKRQIIYGAILGFGVALLLVIYLARRDRRLSDADSLEDAFMVPVLGTVDLGGAGRRSRRGKPPEVDLEAFRLLRTELRYFNVDRRIDTLLVTSPRRADGRSTIAFQLAAAEARSGQSSVLLLEADFRGPTLADRLGEAPGPGVAEVLSGIVPLDEVIQEIKVLPHDRSDVPARLSVLPAGTVPPNPMQLLESEAMEGLLDQLRRRFDMVIIDSPPLAVVSDALPLMRLVAGVVVVTRLGELRYVDARAFNSQLHGAGAPVLGIVANSTRRRRRLGALRVRPA